jgi:hypothetical protein
MPPKRTEPKYWVFRVTGGEEELIDTKEDALEYESMNSEIIEEKFTFTTKAAADKHMRATKRSAPKASTPTKQTTAAVTEKISPDDRLKLDKAINLVNQKRPTNRIELLLRTNSRATKAIALVRWTNEWGQNQWFCKPDVMSLAISTYVSAFKQEDELVHEALKNMSFVKQRDPTKGSDTVKVFEWTSPDKAKKQNFEQHVAFTHFTIPYESIASDKDETDYLLEVSKTIGRTIKRIMQEAPFQECLEVCVRNEQMWLKMNHKHPQRNPGGLSYLAYADACQIHTEMCSNLNTYVVLSDCKMLTTILFNSRLGKRKYERMVSETEDDSQSNSEQGSESPPPTSAIDWSASVANRHDQIAAEKSAAETQVAAADQSGQA